MSFHTVRYTADWRADLVALLARVGTTQLTDEEFAWWFDRNPAGEGIVSLAVDDGEVVGVAAMSFFRTRLDGDVTRLAIPVNVATDPRYRGQGVFSTLEQENERAAAEVGSPLTVTFPNGASHPIFVTRLGWLDLPRLRLWAKPLRAGAVARYVLGRSGEHGSLNAPNAETSTWRGVEVRPVVRFGADFDALGRSAGSRYGNHFVRDAEYFNWRYLDSPRDYRSLASYRDGALTGVAIVGHTFKHGVSAGFLADLVVRPGDTRSLRALLARSVDEVRGGADALVLLPPHDMAIQARARGLGLRADEQAAPLHREDAARRCVHCIPAERLALHPGRLRLLLMKLVFITQQVDPAHPALAATVPKVAALARLVDEVVVLADGAVEDVLPENCRVRTFRASTKAGRGARFETALAGELRDLRGGAVVAHMCPIYAVLAAPLVRPLRVPLVLWFTHWRASRLLQAAERVSSAVVSVDRRSFPIPSDKVRAIGHGIDVSEFACAPEQPADGLRLLALGRYSPAKGLDVVLRALAAVGDESVRLDVHGPALSAQEQDHRAELGRLVTDLPLDGRVRLADAVPRSEIPGLLTSHDALVNNMRAGAPDKVVYEAAAACVPVLASNPVFDSLLEPAQRFDREDPGELADRIRALAALSPAERTALGKRLRDRVEESHSVESWARGVLEAAGLR